jgi:hypothetical protein
MAQGKPQRVSKLAKRANKVLNISRPVKEEPVKLIEPKKKRRSFTSRAFDFYCGTVDTVVELLTG